MFRIMLLALAWVTVSTVANAGSHTAVSNPADCLSFTNDIQRLSCYDTYFQEGPTTLDVATATEKLLELLTSQSSLHALSARIPGSDRCEIEVRLFVAKPYGNGSVTDISFARSLVNFRDVQQATGWSTWFSDGFPKGLVLNYKRGSTGDLTVRWVRGRVPSRVTAVEVFSFLSAMDGIRTDSDREVMFMVLPEELIADQSAITSAVNDMITACGD